MVDPIKRVLIKHPKDAYKNQSKVDQESPQLNYLDVPDFEKAKPIMINSWNSWNHVI